MDKTPVNIICVWTGDAYSEDYVIKLRNMVARYTTRPYHFVCYSDRPTTACDINHIIKNPDFSWWDKLQIFNPEHRKPGQNVYIDLDTVIIDSISPLLDWRGYFAICQNFTRLAGNPRYPCKYGSCVMSFNAALAHKIWHQSRHVNFNDYRYGDQQLIEHIEPSCKYLQAIMPPGFFIGRRDFENVRPSTGSMMIFAGKHKPHNTTIKWLADAWR